MTAVSLGGPPVGCNAVQEPARETPTLQAEPASPSHQVADFTLRVTHGPDAGKSLRITPFDPQPALVGTSAACGLRLTDPKVSRRHLSVEPTAHGLRLQDVGSTNGTRVDRVLVRECVLEGDELVFIGDTTLRVELSANEGDTAPSGTGFGRVLGSSDAMRRLYPLMQRLAQVMVPVVLEGETGTGKEVLAEALHEAGPRSSGPFVVFDCTTVPPNLIESELFGHERGAFTGANTMRRGMFEMADGGTLLIDEVGDLALELQPRLLRALESQRVRRIGGSEWIAVDVRVIAATRRNLDREVQAGRFRDDLFHRLMVARLELPPLRARIGDIDLLTRRFWSQQGGDLRDLSDELLARWSAASWPGNVRELRNAVARMIALGDEGRASPEHSDRPISEPFDVEEALRLPFIQGRDKAQADFERRYVARVLEQCGGDVTRAAEASGIGLRYFQKLRARTR